MKKIIWFCLLGIMAGCGSNGEKSGPANDASTDKINGPPVARFSAPTTVFLGSNLLIDGQSSSDPDGDTLTFLWELKSKPADSLSSLILSPQAMPTISLDKTGDYEISLVVNDGKLSSPPVSLIISAIYPYLSDTGQTIDYTTTYGEDSDYQGNLLEFLDKQDGTILDTITGLYWQKAPNMAYRTYSNALNYCNSLTLGQKNNWRIPNKKELFGVLDLSDFPAIKDPFYRDSGSSSWFWASVPSSLQTASVIINNDTGYSLFLGTTSSQNTRCVSGNEISLGMFIDNNDGTVFDKFTELQWIKAESPKMTWEESLSYCENLDFASRADWRLPNIKEAQSLPDQYYSPSETQLFFPDSYQNATEDSLTNPINPYWSSTTIYSSPEGAHFYDILYGRTQSALKTYSFGVRCVRGGYFKN